MDTPSPARRMLLLAALLVTACAGPTATPSDVDSPQPTPARTAAGATATAPSPTGLPDASSGAATDTDPTATPSFGDGCWEVGFEEDGTSYETPGAAISGLASQLSGEVPDDDPALATLQAGLRRAAAEPAVASTVPVGDGAASDVRIDADGDGIDEVVVTLAGDERTGFVVATLATMVPCADDASEPSPAP